MAALGMRNESRPFQIAKLAHTVGSRMVSDRSEPSGIRGCEACHHRRLVSGLHPQHIRFRLYPVTLFGISYTYDSQSPVIRSVFCLQDTLGASDL